MIIDQILIRIGSGHNMVTLEGWSTLSLEERVDIVRDGRAQFLSCGSQVPLREALAAIKAASR